MHLVYRNSWVLHYFIPFFIAKDSYLTSGKLKVKTTKELTEHLCWLVIQNRGNNKYK